eukprot:jgi/Undpi1/511/HiC_scaffold_10.g03975.m1
MGFAIKPKLMAMLALAGMLLAPTPTRAVLQMGKSTLDAISTTDGDKAPAADTFTSTPPLTRSPSLLNTANGITTATAPWVDDVITALDVQFFLDTNPPLETADSTANRGSQSWLAEIVSVIMVAANLLLAPLGVRVGRGCERDNRANPDNSDADVRDDRSPDLSFLGSLKDAAHKLIDKAGSSLRAVANFFGDVFDDAAGRRARLVHLAAKFDVFDLSPRHGRKRHDSQRLIEIDITRLVSDKDVSAGVQLVCQQAAVMFPEVGYNQGFDAACKAIFISVGKNVTATLEIFTKWAVPVAWLLFDQNAVGEYAANTAVGYTWSVVKTHAAPVFGWLSRDKVVGRTDQQEMLQCLLGHVFYEALATCCSRLGLNKRVMNEVLEETMRAGVHGPGVTLYVVFCLLCMAERDGAEKVREVTMVRVPVRAAARKVRSFSDLQKQAPITLEKFLRGYRAAMANTPLGEELSE